MTKSVERIDFLLPRTIVQAVDDLLVEHKELGYDRQQFIEESIRDKITKLRTIDNPPNTPSRP